MIVFGRKFLPNVDVVVNCLQQITLLRPLIRTVDPRVTDGCRHIVQQVLKIERPTLRVCQAFAQVKLYAFGEVSYNALFAKLASIGYSRGKVRLLEFKLVCALAVR